MSCRSPATLILLAAPVMLRAGCEAQRSYYTALNRSIVITDKAQAEAYPRIVDAVTQKLRGLLQGQIIASLSEGGALQPQEILRQIRCIQSGLPQYAATGEITNLPVAFPLGRNARAVAVGYMIFRGGAGAPDARPYLDVFQKGERGWEDVGDIGSAYIGHSFHVQPLDAGMTGQNWFFLWGKQIGAANAPLRIAVAVYNGRLIIETWSKDMPSGTLVEHVAGDQVILAGETTNSNGRAEDFEEEYKAVPEGLKLVSRSITKTY